MLSDLGEFLTLFHFLHSNTMYAILPQTEGFIWDDAEYFDNKDSAYDSAWDWSAELNGVPVNVYIEGIYGYDVVSQVFS